MSPSSVKSLVWTISQGSESTNEHIVVVMPIASRVSRSALGAHLGLDDKCTLSLSPPDVAVAVSGFQIGTIPPVSTKKIRTIVDISLASLKGCIAYHDADGSPVWLIEAIIEVLISIILFSLAGFNER